MKRISTMSDDELVEALQDVERGLTGWELDFIESVSVRLDGGGSLTDKQRETAENILERYL